MSIRVVISDIDGTFVHGNAVKSAIITGYGSDISAQIEIRIEDLSASLAYAQSIGAIAVVRSVSDLASSLATQALPYWSTIATFMAMFSNEHIEVSDPASIPIAIITTTRSSGSVQGAEGAYGNCLEFLDSLDGSNSGANGRVAGKLLKIYDTRNKGWIDARLAARQTASHPTWDKFSGYGFIDVEAANTYVSIWELVTPPFVPVITNLPNLLYVYTS